MKNRLNSRNYFVILNMVESCNKQGMLPKSVFFWVDFSIHRGILKGL